jgi:hypothetical protein
MTYQPSPNPQGEREYNLRKRFEREWLELNHAERQTWIQQAITQCKAKQPLPPPMLDLIDTYAWTLFAESCDPAEAKAIANGPFKTTNEMQSTGWEF